jgi:hypothetical protein
MRIVSPGEPWGKEGMGLGGKELDMEGSAGVWSAGWGGVKPPMGAAWKGFMPLPRVEWPYPFQVAGSLT